MLGLEYSSEYGGGDADHLFTVVLAEEFGKAAHGSIGMALGVQTDMATPSLHRFGTEELKQKYLAPAIRGEMVAAVTEYLMHTVEVTDGDWTEDFGDANFYGPGFFYRYGDADNKIGRSSCRERV